MLHLASCGVGYDPECWAIMQSIRDVRQYGLLAHDLARYAGDRSISNGPVCVCVLVSRPERLGWQLQPTGVFQDDFGPMAWEELVVRLKWSWMDVIATEMLHRDSMVGLHRADQLEVQRIMTFCRGLMLPTKLCCEFIWMVHCGWFVPLAQCYD